MNTFRTRLAVLLTVLVLGAFSWAAEPFTLGPVIKLGTSTHASLPVFSDGGGVQGGLIYNLDAGSVYFNNGTTWAQVGPTASAAYWLDAGPGYIWAPDRIAAPDGGGANALTTFTVSEPAAVQTIGNGPAGIELIGTGTAGQTFSRTILRLKSFNTVTRGEIFTANGHTSGQIVDGLNFGTGAGMAFGFRIGTDYKMTINNGTGLVTIHQASGSDALLFPTSGARLHIGAGTVDYMYSDGTGILSPSYFQSNVATGASGYKLLTAGARIKLSSTGTNDYLYSDGTNINTPSELHLEGTTGLQLYGEGDSTFGMVNAGISAATANANTPAIKAQVVQNLDVGDHIWVACHGGSCSYDFTVNAGAPAEAINGLVFGSTANGNASWVSSERGFVTNPSACTASTTTDSTPILADGGVFNVASSTPECVVGVPGVALQAGLMLSCININTGVVLRCLNITAGNLTPPAGTYTCMCLDH